MTGLLAGKRGLIMGVANERSIAWGIAKIAHSHGAKIAFTYQGEILKKRVAPLVDSINEDIMLECDITSDDSIDNAFISLSTHMDRLDFIVHSIAFADKNELRGRYLETTRSNFAMALDASCYSLTAVIKRAEHMMTNGGSVIAMTYIGAEKAVPNYNVMGVAKAALEASVKYLATDVGPSNIRVNAISAGPIKTLASAGIGDFKNVLDYNAANSPLRRNVDLDDIAGTALFLLSDISKGVTGETIHVDCGYHSIGMPRQIT